MEKVYQSAQSVNLCYSFSRDRQFSLQETFIFSMILIQEPYITFTDCKKRTIPENMFANIHMCTTCISIYICTTVERHMNPREITEPSQQAHAWLVWPPYLPHFWIFFQQSKRQITKKVVWCWQLPWVLLTCLISVVPLYTSSVSAASSHQVITIL